ncbi:2'-5' RNA ligase family protein [Chitinophaga hostae]|nr:2'-5' RNA ligase family protein [Chitinophaga hostae]
MAPISYVYYFIIISPCDRIKKIVEFFKILLDKIIPLSKINLYSKPHISLMKFSSTDDDEQVIRKVKDALSSSQNFEVELNGSDIFQHGDLSTTLFLKISNPTPIEALYQLLLTADLAPVYRKKITPHLTIARTIPNDIFAGRVDLSKFDYYDSFLCKHITILKQAPGESYRELATIPLRDYFI